MLRYLSILNFPKLCRRCSHSLANRISIFMHFFRRTSWSSWPIHIVMGFFIFRYSSYFHPHNQYIYSVLNQGAMSSTLYFWVEKLASSNNYHARQEETEEGGCPNYKKLSWLTAVFVQKKTWNTELLILRSFYIKVA